jgi:hypothetical protein
MSSSIVAQTIIVASQKYTLSVYFLILIGGWIGNICNIIVFNDLKIFRRNQCAFYLIIASITDIFLLIIVLPFRVADYVFNYDPTQFSLTWCKIRQSIVPVLSLMSFSAICFAAIDQYLTTHYKPVFRQLSSLKLAHRLVFIADIIWTIHGIPFLIFFEIQSTFGCAIYNEGFQIYDSFIHYCILNGILPITLSGFTAVLAYSNVRRIVRHQVPIVRRRLDRQMTAMILTKVAFLVVTTSPFVAFHIYLLNRSIDPTDSVRLAMEQLIYTITSSLFYSNSAVGDFYLMRYFDISSRF